MGKQLSFTELRDRTLNEVANTRVSINSKNLKSISDTISGMKKDSENNKIIQEYERKKKQQDAINDLRKKNEDMYLLNTNVVGRLIDGLAGDRSGIGTMLTGEIKKDKKGNFVDSSGKVIPLDQVNKMVNQEAAKHASSNAYHYGAAMQDLSSTALGQGLKGTLGAIPSLAEFALSGIGDIIDTTLVNPFRDEKGQKEFNKASRKNSLERTLAIKSLLNKVTGGNIDSLNESVQEDNNALEGIYAEEKKQGKQFKSTTENILDTVFDKGINKGIDWFTDGLTGDKNENDTYKELQDEITNRAMNTEGKAKGKMFNNEGLSKLSKETVSVSNKIFNPQTGKIEDSANMFPSERLAEGSEDLLDTEILSRNDDGSVKLDKNGMPLYTNKYSLGEKLKRASISDYVLSKYNAGQTADLVGNSLGFVIAGKSAGGVSAEATGKVLNAAAKTSKALNLAGRTATAMERLPLSVNKAVSRAESVASKVAGSKVGSMLGRPFSKRMVDTMLTSYLLTNLESEQIGEDAYKNTYESIINKYSNIDLNDITEEIRSKNPGKSEEEIGMIAKQKEHQLRNEFEENPENSKIVKEAAIAGSQAESFATATNNSLAFLTNLTSAGLFVKAPSFARNLLTNPLSRKGLVGGVKQLALETVQEGIEEGFINQVSQKGGESFGKTGKFSFDDYIENDLLSTESLEQGMIGALMGFAQTGFTMGSDVRSKRAEAIKQKANIQELMDLKALPPEQIKKLITSSFNVDEVNKYAQQIAELTKEGKTEEVKVLQDKLLLNQSVRAAVSGTSQVMTDTLTAMLNNEEFNTEDKINIQKAISFNEMIADTHDKHIAYNNRNGILQNRGNKFLIGEMIKQQESTSLVDANAKYNEAVDRTVRKSIESSRESMSDTQLEELTNNYASILENNKQSFSPTRSGMSEYNTLMQTKEGLIALQNIQDTLDDNYNEMISPEAQQKYKKQIGKELTKNILRAVTGKSLKDSKEQILEEKLNDTEEEITVTNQLDKEAYDKENKEQRDAAITDAPTVPGTEEDAYDGPALEDIEYPADMVALMQQQLAQQNPVSQVDQDQQDLEDEEGSPLNAPMGVDSTDKSKQAVAIFADTFKDGKGTFKGVIGAMLNQDPSFTDEYFDHIVEGYNEARPNEKLSKEEAKRIYEQVFGSIEQVQNNVGKVRQLGITPSNTATPSGPVLEVDTDIVEEAELEGNGDTSVIVDMVTGERVDNYKGYKTNTADVKLSFIGQEIEVSEDGTGYINATNTVTPEAHAAIHFENFKPGDKVKLEINWDYFTQNEKITTNTQFEDGTVQVNSKTIQEFVEDIFGKGSYTSFQAKMKTPEGKAELLANPQFLGSVPTNTILADGTVTQLGINSMDWWNTKNVALETNEEGEKLYERQKQVIQEAKERNLRLRQSLAANNTVELTVESKTEGFHNKQLPDGTSENGSSKFQSIIDAFGGNTEAALQTVGLGAMDGNAPASYHNADGKVVLSINGRPIVLDESNSNIVQFIKKMKESAGTANGKNFMVYQNGYNQKGNPQYIVRAIITDHASKEESYKQQYGLLSHIDKMAKKLSGQVSASENEIEKAKKIQQFFKKEYNVDILDWKQFNNKIREFYPKSKGAESISTSPNKYRQDYKFSNKENSVIPDFTGFNTIAEMESAILGGTLPKTTAKELYMKNAHTQYVFSEIVSEQHAPVWTTDVQPKIKFSDEFSQEQRKEEKKREVEEKKAQLQTNEVAKVELKEQLAKTEDPLEKRTIQREIKKIETEEVTIKNELATEGVVVQDVVKEDVKAEKPAPAKLGENDIDTVNQHIMYSALKAINTKEFTEEDIYREAAKQLDLLIESMKDRKLTKEVNFLEKNRNKILGIGEGNYDGSVREMVQTLYDIQQGEAIAFTAEYIKDSNKESFENDITASLSMRVKMLLSGIEDGRADTSENIGALPEYFSFKDTLDFLQQALSEAHNNSLEDLKKVIESKIAVNPKEFSFYQDIYDRLETLNKVDPAFLNEIMYFLHQPKVDMTFMMYSVNDAGEFRIQKYDANAKNPQIAKNAKWKENLKTSPLIKLYEENFYKVDEDAYSKVETLYNEIVDARDNNKILDFEKLTDYFAMFGIRLNEATLGAMNSNAFNNLDYTLHQSEEVGQKGKGILATNQIFELLYKNIKKAKEFQDKGVSKLTLNRDAVTAANHVFLSPLSSHTTSALKRLIDVDNMMSAYNLNSMRIAGKSINPFQQPKSITNTISKLKNDAEFIKKLLNTPITQNSLIVEMLEKHPELKQHFSVNTLSLEALKQRGTDSRDDMGPTALSDLDSMVTLFNLFAENSGNILTPYNGDDTISMRKGSMVFPALSDSSQQPILNTFLFDVKRSNFDDIEMTTLSDNMVKIIVDKMVANELNRTASFLISNSTTNIKGHDAGAQFINSLMSLNSMLVDSTIMTQGGETTVSRPLIEVFKNHNNKEGKPWLEDVNGFIQQYSQEIYGEVRENITSEVNKVMKTFLDEGILNINEETGTSYLKHIDSKYLESKDNMSGEEKARLIATDYVFNNLITLNEIQNLFAGDTANYFKDKMGKDLEFGLPKVTISDLNKHYGYNLTQEYLNDLVSNINDPAVLANVRTNYPKLLSATELALTDNLDQRIEDTNAIARIKMVEMYKDVQNNLSKRLKELISPGSQYPNSQNNDQRYYQIMLQDVNSASEVLHSLARRFYPEKASQYADMIDRFKALDDIYETNRNDLQKKRHKILKDKLSKELPEVSSFLENASTDAQEYATWQDNLNQLRNQGRVTEDEFNVIFDRLLAQAKDIEDYGHITKETAWKPEEKDLRSKSVMQVSKPLYSGHHLETKNGYNHSRYIYIKSSSFALTPELTQGFPKLNAMRKNMEKWQEVDPKSRRITSTIRASYDSANKVGAVKNGLSITELYKDNPDLGQIGDNTVELEKANFFIQQDKPFKSDSNAEKGKRDEITRATQFEKILLGDGINKIEDHVFPNLFDPSLLADFGVEAVDGKLNGPQLKQIYDGIYEREQKLLTEKYNRELGITDINDIANGKPEVLENLVNKLKARLSNKQDLKALELEYKVRVDGKAKTMSKAGMIEAQDSGSTVEIIKAQLKIPLYMMPNSNKFESVLNSMINKSNINLKLPGFSSPVGSQEGFDFKGYSAEEYEQARKNGLITTKNFDPTKGLQATRTDENGNILPAQVFVANKNKVYNRETGKYEYVNLMDYVDENNQIDTSKMPEELLSMFSFRIPTSSHQSGVVIEIAGFLPHTSADLMIVPKDHTTQIGEDYDIDMRYVYQYNYIKDTNGNLKKLEYSDIERPEKTSKEFKREHDVARDNLWRQYYQNVSKVDQNNPLATESETRLINPVLEMNKNTIEEISRLQEAYDNYELDKLLHAMFQDDYEIEDVSKEFLKSKINELEDTIIPEGLEENAERELRRQYRELKDSMVDAYKNEKSELGTAWKAYKNSINQKADELKIMENNLVGLYKSVFTSNDDGVQKLINKTLSTDSAEETANEMDRTLNSENPSPYYSFHSPSVQRDVTKLGSSGKIGIGEHSNAVTMNSIFQQSGETHQIFQGYNKEGEIIPYNIQLGDFVFDGVMGHIEVNGTRISEMAMEDQNSATDNQKLQIMGRRNEDKNTMSVLKILHSRGLDKDSNGRNMSYASLFINQPILREYSKLVNSISSASSSRRGNARKQAVKQLKTELEKKLPADVWQLDENGKPNVGVLDSSVRYEVGKSMTSTELYDQLIQGQDLFQYVVLSNFEKLQNAATTYNDMQKLVNIESGGMGVSYFDTIESMETLLKVATGEVDITNSASMIGEYKIAAPGEDLSSEGYVPVITKTQDVKLKSGLYVGMTEGQTVWIKPTNHYSHKIVNSIALGYNTYNSLFPYNSDNINYAINDILSNLNISSNTEEGKEQKYKIVSDLKDYIYTNNQSLFGDVEMARQELFFDTNDEGNIKGNESLATYLLKLSQNPAFADMFRKPFFRDLSYKPNKETFPSMIEFNNSDISKVNTNAIYNNFERMMRSNKKLPAFNGKDYNARGLMKDLLKYSLLADQGRGAIGFRQHLPIELFEKYGVTKGISKTSNVSGNFQAIAYHGATKSLVRALGERMNEDGSIDITNKSLSTAKIKGMVNSANTVYEANLGVPNAMTYDVANNKIIFNYHDGSSIKSTFVKQYIQHNPKLVANIAGKKLGAMLTANKYQGLSEVTKNNVREFYFESNNDFLTIEDENGRLLLYEQVADNFYRQIPTLGVFGLKEYNIRQEQKQSSIAKNNPIVNEKVVLATDKSVIPSMMSAEDTEGNKIGTNLERVIQAMKSADPSGTFRPLFDLFGEFVKFENVQIVMGPVGKDYKAQYFPSGKIVINPSLLEGDTFNMEEVSKAIAEEMIHHVTVNSVGRYITFTGINPETGKVGYEAVRDEQGFEVTIPAEIHSLVNVYNFAIQKMIEKHGLTTILDKMKGQTSHLGAETGAENDAYRVSNIHEFLAGIFLKNDEFAQEMANTPYRSSGKSIAEKFFQIIDRFFHRVIPSLKKETVSGEVTTSLFSLLNSLMSDGKKGKSVTMSAKNLRAIYDTPEKRRSFAESLKVLEKAESRMSKEDLMSEDEDLDFENYKPDWEIPKSIQDRIDKKKNQEEQPLNAPVAMETFGEQAIKCK